MSSSFLDVYKKENPQTSGIPFLEMNAPLVTITRDGHVGIELEVEGTNLPNGGFLDGVKGPVSKTHWESKEDGSLRGGREYVTSGPCFIDEVEPLVDGFFKRCAVANTTINNSNRCSTHVHVNVSGLKINHITSILALWSVFETVMIAWCGEERQANHFCLSTSEEDSLVNHWVELLKNGVIPTDGNLKYTALNVLPIWTQGSIEFRCGGPPNEAKKTINWTKFVWNLCKYAKEKYPNPHQLAFDLSERGALEIFRDICAESKLPEEFFVEVFTPFETTFDTTCMMSFRNSQPFVLGFPWGEWEEEINKAYVPNPFASKKKGKLTRYTHRADGFVEPVEPEEGPQPVPPVPEEAFQRARNEARINDQVFLNRAIETLAEADRVRFGTVRTNTTATATTWATWPEPRGGNNA